ncbi:MAG: rRNA maturation RNase YbeY [Oscillospiraceae bacterium]|jgi:probable rRNA maturation factor|nr:rRNA maturation RNase YbeY [Oscillospiraceae bacterium]
MSINLKLLYNDKVKSGYNFRPLAFKCCNAVLSTERFAYLAETSLSLVSDEEIRSLNRRYRKIDRPTDVLSFLSGDPNPDTKAVVLGDIVISAQTAARQASRYGHGIDRELAFLTVHGMLHLLGYDHIRKEDERVMFARQNLILEKLGIIRRQP